MAVIRLDEVVQSWGEMLRAGGRRRASAFLQIYAGCVLVVSAVLLRKEFER